MNPVNKFLQTKRDYTLFRKDKFKAYYKWEVVKKDGEMTHIILNVVYIEVMKISNIYNFYKILSVVTPKLIEEFKDSKIRVYTFLTLLDGVKIIPDRQSFETSEEFFEPFDEDSDITFNYFLIIIPPTLQKSIERMKEAMQLFWAEYNSAEIFTSFKEARETVMKLIDQV